MPRKPGYTAYSPSLDGSEMTPDEWEFLLAMAGYQRRFGRRYPTWREVLHVARCLGYRKVAEPAAVGEPQPPPASEDFTTKAQSTHKGPQRRDQKSEVRNPDH